MWLASILVCATLDVRSCDVSIQSKRLHLTEEMCLEQVKLGEEMYSRLAFYVQGGCLKIGSGA